MPRATHQIPRPRSMSAAPAVDVERFVHAPDPVCIPSGITRAEMHRKGFHARAHWQPCDMSEPYGGDCSLDLWFHFDDEHARQFDSNNHRFEAEAIDTSNLRAVITVLQELLDAVESREGREFTAHMGALVDTLQPYVGDDDVAWPHSRNA